ncbi:MAG: hypothetical protein J7501_10035, partial [Bdellovibrio sp.]|nr:hypothetical protein [Bdellovibrio sp.]
IMLSKKLEEMRQSGELPAPEAPLTYKKPAPTKLQVVEEINKNFFENPKSIAKDNDLTRSEQAFENVRQAEEFLPTPGAPQGSHDPLTSRADKSP